MSKKKNHGVIMPKKKEPEMSTATVFILATVVGVLLFGLFGCQPPSAGYL
jgi:hypothetical protein